MRWVSHLSHHPSCVLVADTDSVLFCHSTLTQYLLLGIRSYFVINKTYHKLSCACVVSGAKSTPPLVCPPRALCHIINDYTRFIRAAFNLLCAACCVPYYIYIHKQSESERRKVLIFSFYVDSTMAVAAAAAAAIAVV